MSGPSPQANLTSHLPVCQFKLTVKYLFIKKIVTSNYYHALPIIFATGKNDLACICLEIVWNPGGVQSPADEKIIVIFFISKFRYGINQSINEPLIKRKVSDSVWEWCWADEKRLILTFSRGGLSPTFLSRKKRCTIKLIWSCKYYVIDLSLKNYQLVESCEITQADNGFDFTYKLEEFDHPPVIWGHTIHSVIWKPYS